MHGRTKRAELESMRVVFDVLLDSQQFMMPFLGFKLAATHPPSPSTLGRVWMGT